MRFDHPRTSNTDSEEGREHAAEWEWCEKASQQAPENSRQQVDMNRSGTLSRQDVSMMGQRRRLFALFVLGLSNSLESDQGCRARRGRTVDEVGLCDGL